MSSFNLSQLVQIAQNATKASQNRKNFSASQEANKKVTPVATTPKKITIKSREANGGKPVATPTPKKVVIPSRVNGKEKVATPAATTPKKVVTLRKFTVEPMADGFRILHPHATLVAVSGCVVNYYMSCCGVTVVTKVGGKPTITLRKNGVATEHPIIF